MANEAIKKGGEPWEKVPPTIYIVAQNLRKINRR